MENEKKLRNVEVKLQNKTFNGLFHGWNQGIGTLTDGTEFVYKVAIIENKSDGKVVEVDPELIRFID